MIFRKIKFSDKHNVLHEWSKSYFTLEKSFEFFTFNTVLFARTKKSKHVKRFSLVKWVTFRQEMGGKEKGREIVQTNKQI